MKQTIFALLILVSLNVKAQKTDYNKAAQTAQQQTAKDTATLVLKGNVQFFEAYLVQLEKLKGLMVLFKSPYDEVVKIDQLIMSIYNQITPQIKK